MCYICSCCVYAIDFIQRIITCGLLCLLGCAVCVGFSIAIIAGIAYGYNYSLAEFLNFKRSDVTVYMRRGQFYDKPDLPIVRRRSGDEDALFAAANRSIDYEDAGSRSQPLADAWLQSQDTRKYAQKLTKYSPAKPIEHFVQQAQDPTPSQPYVVSIPPNPLLATVSWQGGSSEIIMRSYKAVDDNPSATTKMLENEYASDTPIKSIGFLGGPHKFKGATETIAHTESGHQSAVTVRVWSAADSRIIPEYVTEEIEEDSIVYKPV